MALGDFEQLDIVFRRATSLPQLPTTAMQLVEAIDSGEASAKSIEEIILKDPGVTASLIRFSASELQNPSVSIRSAIMRMGQRTVRSMAMSLALQSVMGSPMDVGFDAKRFAQHGIFVGYMARYLYGRHRESEDFETTWSAEEFFAAGLLHDLATGLLAKVTPKIYLAVHSFAMSGAMTLENAFKELFGEPMWKLGETAVDTWKLPAMFVTAIRGAADPYGVEQNQSAALCLNYANSLANMNDEQIEKWGVDCRHDALVEAQIGLPAEELEQVLSFVKKQTGDYLNQRSVAA